ncbi:hypothetical protein [Pseudorhodoplanes sinuspersici]|uniref:Uncharacterized protein n=1 Tax=Pseudorhodoplanes sinuspersici TaxID=1235591 RepID=A0A1W6ZMU7_9HYPH|nr:hypothetical protein [Pseudorhodoplanes sinuspersici]ARP98567.1 hypothetical protein CAK95_05320 [Pseudorhodoplanes sinuspersici]RKE69858.1 hypothetical protein DFP91_4302 [Pseudorhodoplanes sinuspersici]
MPRTLAVAIAALLITSGTTGAMAATRHANHASHGYSTYRPATVPIVPYRARSAYGAVAAPTIGGDCSQRPFARDCDKRGPW